MTTSPKSGSRGTRKAKWELEAAGVSAASSRATRQMTAISLRLCSTIARIYCTQLDRLEQATGNQPGRLCAAGGRQAFPRPDASPHEHGYTNNRNRKPVQRDRKQRNHTHA